MKAYPNISTNEPDPAAVFAAAVSLWKECHKQANGAIKPQRGLSASYNGIDELMREVMRIATLFESWSCAHVDFDEMIDVWPYLLEERLGRECLSVLLPDGLSGFDESTCRYVAARLRISIR